MALASEANRSRERRGPPVTSLVMTHGGGRFANQLMTFAHLIGLVREHPEFRVLNVAFWRFSDLCAGTEDNRLCVYPKPAVRHSGEALVRMLLKLGELVPSCVSRGARVICLPLLHRCAPWQSMKLPEGQEWKLGSDEFLRRVRGRRRVLLSGWRLRDWQLFARHQDVIREFLRPTTRIYGLAEKLIRKVREKHQTLVGVLIRQTDYRVWEGGKFFLSTHEYRSCLEQLRGRFGNNTAFLVACDERQPDNAFEGLPVYWCTGAAGVGSANYIESFAQLSLCDCIASVPSTFSAWAAFIGRKPILPIFTGNDELGGTSLLMENLLDAYRHPVFRAAVQ